MIVSMRLLVLSLILLFSLHAQAIEWVCSKDPYFSNLASDGSEFLAAEASFGANGTMTLSPKDLINIMQGGHVKLYGKTPTLCVYPVSDSRTQKALLQLNIAPSVLRSYMKSNSIIERKIRMVYSEGAMESCVSDNAPAIGVMDRKPEQQGLGPCF